MNDLIKPSSFEDELNNIISIFQGSSNNTEECSSLIPSNIEERAKQRVHNEEILRQKNIEDVIKGAAERLTQDEGGVQTHPVNEDWLRQFKNNVQDISEKEMKLIWSKVLAGEMKQPKSFSIRTLHLLGKLSKEDANIITKIAPFILCDSDNSGRRIIIHSQKDDDDFFEFEDLLFLNELGLIETSASLHMNWHFDKNVSDFSNCIKLYNGNIGININLNVKEYGIPVYTVTMIGNQIFSLIEDVTPRTDYYKKIIDKLNFFGKCNCGHIKEDCGDKGYVFNDFIFNIDKSSQLLVN